MQQADIKPWIIKHPIFTDLSEEQITSFLQTCNKITLQADEFLIKEGDTDKQCYLILKGSVEVIKIDAEQTTYHLMNLAMGEIVGSIVLLDNKTRSATVRCIEDCEFIIITQHNLEQFIGKDKDYYRIIKNIGANLCTTLRQTNEASIAALREKMESYRIRAAMGRLLVVVIVALSFLSFYNMIAAQYIGKIHTTSYITVILMAICTIFLFCIIKIVKLPLSSYGITSQGVREAFIGALLYSIPVCILVIITKWLLIRYSIAFVGGPLFTPYAGIRPDVFEHPSHIWIINTIIYAFGISPFQELMARSGLQAILEHLLIGRLRGLWAIIASNIIFMTAHLFISTLLAILVFFTGLFFGWLFHRYKNIIAPITAHTIIGVWGLHIVGFT